MFSLVIFALVAGATASRGHYDINQGGNYYYGGRFAGKCGHDGLYFKDRDSFVICSNGNGYIQPCAPGSRNGDVNGYKTGAYYNYNPFCGVNLVDHGYAARHSGYNRVPKGYGSSTYTRQSYSRPSGGYNRKTRTAESYGRPHSDGYQRTTYTKTYKAPSYVNQGYRSQYGKPYTPEYRPAPSGYQRRPH